MTETRNYATQKNEPSFKVDEGDLKCFIGFLILTGYNQLPSERNYWDSKPDMNNPMVTEAMRRDRYLQLKRFIHLNDNSKLDKSNKLYKLQPLISMLKERFLKYFVPSKNLCYDECMVQYFGRHSSKQCIRNKPIRFGYKVWCINSVNGYLVNFDIYTGKNIAVSSDQEKAFGKATAPLIHMLDEFPSDFSNLPYHIFLDNLFTSFNLLKHLKDNGYNATGTMRENRIPRSCPLPSNKIMKREKRGTCPFVIEHTDGVFICKWVDNNVVSVASTKYGYEPANPAKRYSRAEKKNVVVPQPHCISQYNKSMGGTDRMDQDVNRYKIGIRGKKWWFALFTWMIDVAVNNAWIIYKESSGTKIPKLQFCRELAQTYLIRYKTPIKFPGPVARAKNQCLNSIRMDGLDHYVAPIDKRRRCANKPCTSVVKTICQKCDVGLCVHCFVPYHNK